LDNQPFNYKKWKILTNEVTHVIASSLFNNVDAFSHFLTSNLVIPHKLMMSHNPSGISI